MGFKFLNQNIPDQPETVEAVQDRFMELVNHRLENQLALSTDNRPAVFLNLSRNRDTISEQEWDSIIHAQRRQLIEYMWQQGMVMHTIISEDEYGFTLRTELLF
jgi:hypothetical protein